MPILSQWRQDAEVGALQRLIWTLIVARFRELEREQGLRKVDLSQRLGIPRSQVQMWLAAPRNMTLKSAGRLAIALDARLVCGLEPLPIRPGAARGVGTSADPEGR